jgi:hypothetical protein
MPVLSAVAWSIHDAGGNDRRLYRCEPRYPPFSRLSIQRVKQQAGTLLVRFCASLNPRGSPVFAHKRPHSCNRNGRDNHSTSLPYAPTRPLPHAAKALDTQTYNPFPERSQMPSTIEQILPDRKALKNVEREYPTAPSAEKYRLAQADTLIRLTHGGSIEEMERMLADRSIQQLIHKHNQRIRRTDLWGYHPYHRSNGKCRRAAGHTDGRAQNAGHRVQDLYRRGIGNSSSRHGGKTCAIAPIASPSIWTRLMIPRTARNSCRSSTDITTPGATCR